MAIVGWEWLVVIGIILVIFLWGPQKLPELARSIGQAKKEFDKAAREVTTAATAPAGAQQKPEPDALLETAWKLGISTEGKTREQISEEIVEKAREGKK